jgi:hypothetical protein
MEFENLVSSPRAVSDLSRLLGLHKVKPKDPKSPEKAITSSLSKACKLSKKVIIGLKPLLGDSTLLSEYMVIAAKFTAISGRIISKLGGNLDVKEDIETP